MRTREGGRERERTLLLDVKRSGACDLSNHSIQVGNSHDELREVEEKVRRERVGRSKRTST